jgi:hypothetical protein
MGIGAVGSTSSPVTLPEAPAADAAAAAATPPAAADATAVHNADAAGGTLPSWYQGSPLQTFHGLRDRMGALDDAQQRFLRVQGAMGDGPAVDALRGEVVARGRDVATFLQDHAAQIRGNEGLSQAAGDASRRLAANPTLRGDNTIAGALSSAAGVLEVGADLGQSAFAAPAAQAFLESAGRIAGVGGGAAGAIDNASRLLGRDGNFGDAIAAVGSAGGIVAAARGSSPLGWGSLALEVVGKGIADHRRGEVDRTTMQAAMVRAGVPEAAARAIADANPDVIRGLTDRGMSAAMLIQVATVAPQTLRLAPPPMIDQIGRWPSLTPERLQTLQNLERLLAH